ncbi:SpaH/EbpB family LPXTG-anchored major pilin [Bifidobacterium sp. 81T8]|nr:SpaH/EbpB family LPXTG-anchored major pilin [Bifidobacterium simiiventris]
MKSLIKKLAAVIIAAATMLGTAGLGAVTATAAGSATLTVTSAQSAFVGKTVKYVKMFTATDNDNNGTYDYALDNAWKDFFKASKANGGPGIEGVTDANVSAKAEVYIKGLSEEDLATFADLASAWAQKTDSGIKLVESSAAAAVTDSTAKAAVTIGELDLGYYLVVPPTGEGAPLGIDGKSHAILANVTDPNVSINLKKEFPTVDKTVDDKDHNKADDKNIGDTVNFTLTSTVPDMTEYTTYKFLFHDTLSKGLTYTVNSVTVKVDGTELKNIADKTYYTVTDPSKDNGNTLTVEMNDFKANFGDKDTYAGKSITVEYSATLNADAEIGNAGNQNSATVEYSNDPKSDGTGTSVPSIVKVHTFGFTVDKYTGDTYNESSLRLAGAKFKLYKSAAADATPIDFVVNAGTGSTATTARLATSDDKKEDSDTKNQVKSEIETPAYGRITYSGLEAGTYYLEESAAPAGGYTKQDHKIKVVITANYDKDTKRLTDWKIDYYTPKSDGTYAATATGTDTKDKPVVPFLNKKGLTLPSTGGMGTILFSVFGVLIVALGTAWYVKSNRKSTK